MPLLPDILHLRSSAFICGFLLTIPLPAATRAPDFTAALASAESSGGHIFAFYHGSDWCRLGEKVKATVWDDSTLATSLGDDALMVAIDQRESDGLLVNRALERSRPQFTPFSDPALSSANGTKFTRQADGSWLATVEGAPAKDDYLATLRVGANPLEVLAIEALADPSLPNNGPGMYSNGNFCLSQVEAKVGDTPLPFTAAWADRAEKHLTADLTIDEVISEKGREGWSAHGSRHHGDTILLLVPEEPIPPKSTLRLTLRFASPWGQHAIGRLKLSSSADTALAEAAGSHHRHTLLARANSRAGKITRYPGVAAFDSSGNRIGVVEGLGLDTTTAKLTADLKALGAAARERDELFVRAESAEGKERAALFSQGLALAREHNGFPWADGKRGNPSRTKILEAILAADPDDTEGWHRFLSFNAGALAKEANELIKQEKFEDALVSIEKQISHPLNERLEPGQLQELQVQKFHLFRQWKGREEDRFYVMEEIARIDPTTHTGIGATGYLMMHGRGPASLTHGWLPKHLQQGEFSLTLSAGVAREFDHRGRYRLTARAGKGEHPLTIKSLALLADGKEVSRSNTPATLQTGQLTRAEWILELPANPTGRPLALRLDCEAPSGTDSSGTFSVKPLLGPRKATSAN